MSLSRDSSYQQFMPTTHRLDFLKPAFHPGLNLTVRRGDKWLKTEPGDILQLSLTGAKDAIQDATTMFTAFIPFASIPKAWLNFEHAAAARTLPGLFAGMVSA